LLKGDSSLSVSAVNDARARRQLEGIQNLFGSMQGEISEVLERSPELFRVRSAANAVFVGTTGLLATSEHLLTRYAALEGQRLVQWWFGFAFGGAAILLLLLRGLT